MNYTSETSEKLPESTYSLYQAFSEIPDPRQKRGIRYPLAVLLTVITLAKLSGETELRGIAQWAQYRAQSLWEALGQERNVMPHWSTYSRMLGQLDEQTLQVAIQRGLSSHSNGQQLIIDGKTLRGTVPTGQSQGEHLLALYDPDRRNVVAQVSVGAKENEIVVGPRLLAKTVFKGKVVTGDAMFTQRELSQQIIDAGGNYLWIVKENQPRLRQMIERLFCPDDPRPGHGHLVTDFQSTHQVNKGHGRLERRTLTSSGLLNAYADWPGIQQVFRLERHRQPKDRPATCQVVYGITSLSAEQASPHHLLAFTRRHWAIENQLHYVRDVSLREDACRLKSRQAQCCLAVLNNLVLALASTTPFAHLPDAQRFFNAHLSHACALLF
jgi:predicted transposase YbfD/YdcC